MGYNTPVLILNDAMDGLNTDTGVGRRMYDAISECQSRGSYKSFPIGHCGNGGMVLASEHADNVQIIAVGGNYMKNIATLYFGWRTMSDPVELIKLVAAKYGYRLVKKPGHD